MGYDFGYGNSMDRYVVPDELVNTPLEADWTSGLDIGQIGISAPPMKDALKGLKAKIFQGAGRVELGFMGKGKGAAS